MKGGEEDNVSPTGLPQVWARPEEAQWAKRCLLPLPSPSTWYYPILSLSLFLCFCFSLSVSLHTHTYKNIYTQAHAQNNIHHVQNTHASHTTITTNIHARTHAHILNTNVQNAQTKSRFPLPLKTYLISLFKCPSPAPLLPPPDSPSFHVADDLRWDHVRRPSTHPVQQATTVITE